MIRPQGKGAFAKKNNIIYAISSPTAIKKVNITLDGNTVKSFVENSLEVFASKEIDLSNYTDGNHSLGITAIDENNMTKTAATTIQLTSEDKTLPFLQKEQSKVAVMEDGKYEVSLIFDDEISGVKGGKIYEKDGTKPINTFKLQATSFTSSKPEIRVEVEDYYGNILKEEINLTAL